MQWTIAKGGYAFETDAKGSCQEQLKMSGSASSLKKMEVHGNERPSTSNFALQREVKPYDLPLSGGVMALLRPLMSPQREISLA